MDVPEPNEAKGRHRSRGHSPKALLLDLRERPYRLRHFVNISYFFVVLILVWAVKPTRVRWMPMVGAGLAVIGIAVRLWASGHIRKNDELATDGPYAFARHPLYVGNFLLGIGFSLASSIPWLLAVWVLIFWFFHSSAIKREDLKLSKRFPETWPQWAARTPALLPTGLLKLKAWPRFGHWSLRQSLRNGEPYYAVVLLAGLVWLYVRLL